MLVEPFPGKAPVVTRDDDDLLDDAKEQPQQNWTKMGHLSKESNGNEDDDDDNQEATSAVFTELPKDASLFLLFPRLCSFPFLFGCFVVLMQFSILTFVAFDLVWPRNHQPKYIYSDANYPTWNIPAVTKWEVIAGQVAAIVITIVGNEDFKDTYAMMALGFRPEYQNQHQAFGHVNPTRFLLVVYVRALVLLASIGVTLVLVLQSTSVLELFFNFAGLSFINQLDNMAYSIAADGWAGRGLREITALIEKIEIIPDKNPSSLQQYRGAVMFLFLAAMLVPFSVAVRHQTNLGILYKGSCKIMDIQIGGGVYRLGEKFALNNMDNNGNLVVSDWDQGRVVAPSFNASAPPDILYEFFSGQYIANFDPFDKKTRIYYVERSSRWSSGLFYYCDYEKAWVFTIVPYSAKGVLPMKPDYYGKEGCYFGWLMRSPVTQALTLDEAPLEDWIMWTGVSDPGPEISVTCASCRRDIDCSGMERGYCEATDEDFHDFEAKECSCYGGVGTFCNKDLPCSHLVLVNDGVPPNNKEDYYVMATTTEWFRRIHGYRRPIYYKESSADNSIEVIIYAGIRFLVVAWSDKAWREIEALLFQPNELHEWADVSFHAYWDDILGASDGLRYFSEPTDEFSPAGSIEWFKVGETGSIGSYGPFGYHDEEESMRFECASVDCDERNVCGKFGACNPNAILEDPGVTGGQCSCSPEATGFFCEIMNETTS